MILTWNDYRLDMQKPVSLGQVLYPLLPEDLMEARRKAGLPEESRAQANAFFAPPFRADPFRAGDFVGATLLGSVVNFFDLRLNPHGNGTHTECLGHIAREPYVLSECLRSFAFGALLLSVELEQVDAPKGFSGQDEVLSLQAIQAGMAGLVSKAGMAGLAGPAGKTNRLPEAERPFEPFKALVLRTGKETLRRGRNWSGTNPPYVQAEALEWLAAQGFEHLLLDLPSVDREEDGGALAAHRAWWSYPEAPRLQASITELIVVPDALSDGPYLLHLQVPLMHLDAAPSNPVLYALMA